jgi:hypothetical protein
LIKKANRRHPAIPNGAYISYTLTPIMKSWHSTIANIRIMKILFKAGRIFPDYKEYGFLIAIAIRKNKYGTMSIEVR